MRRSTAFTVHGDVPPDLVELCQARSTPEALVLDVRPSAGLYSVAIRTFRGELYLRVNAAGEQARRSPYGIEQVLYDWLPGWPVEKEPERTPRPAA